jgi:DNA polymerase III delta subunit
MDKKRLPVARDLYAELEKKRTARIYLFLGEDEGEKDKAVLRIADLVLVEDSAGHTLGRFHCESGELMQAADFALSRSMFADARLCVMLNVDAASGTAAGAALLSEVFASLPDSTTLVLTSSANRPPKGLESVPGMSGFQFWPPFEKDLAAYVARTLAAWGMAIDAGAARVLIDLVGRNVRAVDGALEKLRNSGFERVSVETVLSIVGGERERSVFEFVDALFRGDRSSLARLKNLIENNCPNFYSEPDRAAGRLHRALHRAVRAAIPRTSRFARHRCLRARAARCGDGARQSDHKDKTDIPASRKCGFSA